MIGDMQLLKYRGKDGKVQRLNVISRASHKWKRIADRISNNPSKTESLSLQCNHNPSECLRQLFKDCFISNKPANEYSQDWEGIVELLKDVEEEQLAVEVKDMVVKCKNVNPSDFHDTV